MDKDVILVLTAAVGAAVGYIGRMYTTGLQYRYRTQVNEMDLLQRIDELQRQIVDMAAENAALKSEIVSLRQELRKLRRDDDVPVFRGGDYGEGY